NLMERDQDQLTALSAELDRKPPLDQVINGLRDEILNRRRQGIKFGDILAWINQEHARISRPHLYRFISQWGGQL
ncbi:hypothetical protein LTR72_012181, partial [Exophiala xenobiotica]